MQTKRRLCDTRDDAAALVHDPAVVKRVALDAGVGGGEGGGARGRDAEARHRLAGEVFTNAGAQNCTSVTEPRVCSPSYPLQMDIPTLSLVINHFA